MCASETSQQAQDKCAAGSAKVSHVWHCMLSGAFSTAFILARDPLTNAVKKDLRTRLKAVRTLIESLN